MVYFFHSRRVPDDVVDLHELLGTFKHSQIMLSQHDLHGSGTEKGGEINEKDEAAEEVCYVL